MAKKKPYTNQTRKRVKEKASPSVSTEEKELEYTTKIRVDDDRLNDSDTLDTSFLEGRVQDKEEIFEEKKEHTSRKIFFRGISYFIGVFSFFLFLFSSFLFLRNYLLEKEPVPIEKDVVKEKVIDDNYLFVGDSHTDDMDFPTFDFSYPCVRVSSSKMKTSDILKDMRRKIYNYNPSAVILELGQEDLLQEETDKTILSNIEEIIKEIQINRPNAKIYVESLYPVNLDFEDQDIDEEIPSRIVQLNKKLKERAENLDVTYLDLFSLLAQDNQLKKEYTDDGISLNEKGYEAIYAFLKKNL